MRPSLRCTLVTAFCVFLSVVSHARADPSADATTGVERARIAFEAGRHAYEQGAFAEALAHYEEAYAAHPLVALLFNIGRAADSDGQAERAIVAYRRYLELMPEAENRAFVEARIAKLLAVREKELAPPILAAKTESEPAPLPPAPVTEPPAPVPPPVAPVAATPPVAKAVEAPPAAPAKPAFAADRAANEERVLKLQKSNRRWGKPLVWMTLGLTALVAGALLYDTCDEDCSTADDAKKITGAVLMPFGALTLAIATPMFAIRLSRARRLKRAERSLALTPVFSPSLHGLSARLTF